jgi:hypothetical protein
MIVFFMIKNKIRFWYSNGPLVAASRGWLLDYLWRPLAANDFLKGLVEKECAATKGCRVSMPLPAVHARP